MSTSGQVRTMKLEFIRQEKNRRFVFRSSDSPHLLRVEQNLNRLTLDFEGQQWHLVRTNTQSGAPE